MAVRITGVRKDNGNHANQHEAVTHYRWVDEQTNETGIGARQEMVSWIEGGGQAYVVSPAGKAYCYVNTSSYGTKFLQTAADNKWSNNLLSLPEC